MPEAGKRLFLVACQCGPGMGSVSQIGWEWYQRLARRLPGDSGFDSLVLYTAVRNRAALTAAGAPLPGTEVVYIDTEWFAAPLYKLTTRLFGSSEHAIFMFTSLDYFLFDHLLMRRLRERLDAGERGLIHLVTPVSALLPTRVGRLGLPLVIGPLNSGLPSQTNYPEIMRADFQWLYRLKHLARIPQLIFGSLRRAALIYVAMRHVREALPASTRPRQRVLIENGVDLTLFQPAPWPGAVAPEQPLRLIYVGRLVPVKAVGLLLDALARVRAQGLPVCLDIVGEGGMRAAWEAQTQALALGDVVVFHGNLPLPQVAPLMARAHALCLPSVRESGGAVILEAAAIGRPAIVVDFGGPADLVSDETGRVVSAAGPEATIAGFTEAILSLAREPEAWRLRGEAARRVVEASFSWDAKIEAALRDYREFA